MAEWIMLIVLESLTRERSTRASSIDGMEMRGWASHTGSFHDATKALPQSADHDCKDAGGHKQPGQWCKESFAAYITFCVLGKCSEDNARRGDPRILVDMSNFHTKLS